MTRFKRNFWMCTLMSAAMAFVAGPALAQSPVIPSTSQQLDPNMPKHGMAMRQRADQGMMKEGVKSAGKLQKDDAHALWLLHTIDQAEIAQAQLAQAKSQNDKVKDTASKLLDDHKDLDQKVMKLAQDNNVEFEGTATGTGGSGTTNTPGTTTGSMIQNGDHTPASPAQGTTGTESTGGGSSTVEEIPNHGSAGTGGSGAAASAGTASSGSMQGMHAAGSMKLSSADRALLHDTHRQLRHLSGLSGSQFDRAYLTTQVKDHQKAVSTLQGITAQNDDVKDLLKDTLPKLQDHERMAREALQSLRGVGGSGEQETGATGAGQPPNYAPNQTSGASSAPAGQSAGQNTSVNGAQNPGTPSSQSGSATGEGNNTTPGQGTGGSSSSSSGGGGTP